MLWILCFLLALAVIHDLRERRIPNYLTVGGVILAVGLAAYRGGPEALAATLLAMLLGAVAYLPFFALRLVGAGDVKLFGVVGGFVGLQALLPVWIYTALVGGLLGIGAVALSHSFPQLLGNLKLLLISRTYRVPAAEVPLQSIATQTAVRVPYAAAIAAGVIIWMVSQS